MRTAILVQSETPFHIRLAPVPHDLSHFLKNRLHLIRNPRASGVLGFVVASLLDEELRCPDKDLKWASHGEDLTAWRRKKDNGFRSILRGKQPS